MDIAELTLEDEAPAKVLPDIPYASENYAWCAFDARTNCGFFSHMGRWSLNTELWREQLYVWLPDGTVLMSRSIGRGDVSRGPAGALVSQVCHEAGRIWRIEHHGPVQHYSEEQIRQGQPLEEFARNLDLTVDFDGDTPVFFYPQGHSSTWGRWHYEQLGQASGEIHFEGQTHRFEGYAFRDHSRGPRNLADFGGSNWIQCRFEDGTGFALFENWRKSPEGFTPGLSEFVLIDKHGVEDCKILGSPSMDSLNWLDDDILIAVDSPSRGHIDIHGKPLRTVIFSVSDRHETLHGIARGTALGVVAEQPMTFVMNGLKGVGNCERGRRLSAASPTLTMRGDPA